MPDPLGSLLIAAVLVPPLVAIVVEGVPMTDRTVTLAVIILLGVVGIATVIGGLVLASDDKSLPEAVIAIGSGAVGAIAGILAKTKES